MFNLYCFHTISIFVHISWKMYKKMKPRDFAWQWPSDYQKGQGHRKWYKMVEFNGAYKPGRYQKKKKIGWKVCMFCPMLKFLPCKPTRPPARSTWLITQSMIFILIKKQKFQMLLPRWVFFCFFFNDFNCILGESLDLLICSRFAHFFSFRFLHSCTTLVSNQGQGHQY